MIWKMTDLDCVSEGKVVEMAGTEDAIYVTPVRCSSLGFFSLLPDSLILHLFSYFDEQVTRIDSKLQLIPF